MTNGIDDTGLVTRSPGTETAVLAGGCFWGLEDLVRKQTGMLSTRVGYTGGENDHATYRNHPGHAEAIEIVFDPVKTTGPFWEAEPEHQDCLINYPNGYTCHFVRPDWVLPKRETESA